MYAKAINTPNKINVNNIVISLNKAIILNIVSLAGLGNPINVENSTVFINGITKKRTNVKNNKDIIISFKFEIKKLEIDFINTLLFT